MCCIGIAADAGVPPAAAGVKLVYRLAGVALQWSATLAPPIGRPASRPEQARAPPAVA
jgi:hypothetical protein